MDALEFQVTDAELANQTDCQLAARAQRGSQGAYTEIYRRFFPRLVRFVESRMGSKLDAEEVAQETLTKVYREIGRYDNRFQFTTWIYTIAFRIAVDQQRKRSRTEVSISDANVPHKSDCSFQSLEEQETLASIWTIARQELTTGQYSALWLLYGEGLSIKEVAKVLKRTSVGVRVSLHRARHLLRTRLVANETSDVAVSQAAFDSPQESAKRTSP